jgi:glycosyltransferase involved in cell wall biosynthesis
MSKLFIDITELAGWQGKLTGVPRVMDEVAKRYSDSGSTIFVSWKPEGYTLTDFPVSPTVDTVSVATKEDAMYVRAAKKLHAKSKFARKIVSFSRTTKNRLPLIVSPVAERINIEKGDKLLVLADWHGGDPSFVHELKSLNEKGVILIQMVYDMLPIVTPQYSGHSTEMLKNYSTTVYPMCDLIFSISENTKRDVTDWLRQNKLKVPPITVVRLGDDFSRVNPQKPSVEIPKEYILCVGTVEARKNHTLLYYAYKLAIQKGIVMPHIIIVGRVGWLSNDIYELISSDPQVKDKFIFLHGISDNELNWLYKNSLFSVYPSFYEGWGLPIAESIAHGTPVIASNTSSMPEIAGELIDYFSPTSTDECLGAMVKLLKPENRRDAQERIQKYKPASWDQSYDIIKRAINTITESD